MNVLRCEYCGKPLTKPENADGEAGCDGVKRQGPDPYLLEIHGETVLRWMCAGQHYDRKEDV